MSRKRVTMVLYNAEIKEKFLKQYNNPTQLTYRKILYRIAKMEEIFKKDLCDFTANQLRATFISQEPKSINTLIHVVGIVTAYQEFCVRNGFSIYKASSIKELTKEDLVSLMDTAVVQDQFINSAEELYQIIDTCNSAQDAVIVALLYISVRGRASTDTTFEEIINLKTQDVNFEDSKITVTRYDGSTRIIDKVDKQILNVIKDAIEQEYYICNNGTEDDMGDRRYLSVSDYLVRPVQRKDLPEGKVNGTTINNRVSKIAKRIGKPINPRTIFQSGMLNKAKKIEQEKGELSTEEYKKICKDSGLNPERWFKFKESYLDWSKRLESRKG